jgi:hypothetical protein
MALLSRRDFVLRFSTFLMGHYLTDLFAQPEMCGVFVAVARPQHPQAGTR